MLVSMVVMEETVVSLPFKFKENSSLLLRLGEAVCGGKILFSEIFHRFHVPS